jgi:hypothetical protein
MAKLTEFKRLIAEDFPKEDRALASRLGAALNPVLQEIYQALSKNLNFTDNFNSQVKDVEITVDSSGSPKTATSIKSELKSSCKGIVCIKVDNRTNPNAYPSTCPFVSFSESNGQLIVRNVTGLTADHKYVLRLLVLG